VYVCGAIVHVPSAVAPSVSSHTSHAPEHAVLQHWPSTQKPLAQALLAPHGCPCESAHVPDAVHVFEPVHESGSWVFAGTLAHVPTEPARLHIWHVLQSALVQHTWSTQLPLAQLSPIVHAVPVVAFGVQVVPLHQEPEAQSLSEAQLVRHAPVPASAPESPAPASPGPGQT
jgi:hypothetical protein